MATFKANVVLSDLQVYVAGQEVPEWAYDQISNLDVVDGDISTPPADPSGKPPAGGPGSSRDAWAAYATAQGIQITADDSKTAIQAAVDAHEAQAAAQAAAAAGS